MPIKQGHYSKVRLWFLLVNFDWIINCKQATQFGRREGQRDVLIDESSVALTNHVQSVSPTASITPLLGHIQDPAIVRKYGECGSVWAFSRFGMIAQLDMDGDIQALSKPTAIAGLRRRVFIRDVGPTSTCVHPEDFLIWLRVRGGPSIVTTFAVASAVDPKAARTFAVASNSKRCSWHAEFTVPSPGGYEVDAVIYWWHGNNTDSTWQEGDGRQATRAKNG